MKPITKNSLSNYLRILIAAQMLIVALLPVSAQEEPVRIGIKVVNKLEVALAVGPTSVNYATFEADLRAKLALETPAVLDEDIVIKAARAVSANTTKEFSWWVYDHTRATARYNSPTNRQVSQIIDDANHMYVENDASGSQTSNSPGRPQDTDPNQLTSTTTGSTYTPPPEAYSDNTDPLWSLMKNPDVDVITGSVHPYQGNYRHMIESNGGATMDFYGYGQYSYKDFRYLPNNQQTIKTFEFSIAEDLAYDALDGVGFFFNMDIKGSYANETQTMSGYLLFLQYSSSGLGTNMYIFKFSNFNVKDFHHLKALTSGGQINTTAFVDRANLRFDRVASSTAYLSTHLSRRIKIEVAPDKVQAWYVGSPTKNDAYTLNTPISEYTTPVNPVMWTMTTFGETGQQSGTATSVLLDKSIITGYGFGPMSSYTGHGCARPTHLALQNLSMTMDKVRSLTEVVREPDWEENTKKFLVNLNEEPIEDFSSTSITGELLNRLRNDDIYYIGWCSTTNAAASEDFLVKNELKGEIVNINTDGTYLEQIQKIADKIYERYQRGNDNDVVLVTDQVILEVTGAPQTNTADPQYPNGKWKVEHSIAGFEDNDGIYPLSGHFVSDLDLQFNMVGKYDIYFREHFIKTIIAHKAPVAAFSITLDEYGVPSFVDNSYDPDYGKAGIVSSEWSYLNLDNPNNATLEHISLVQLMSKLSPLPQDETFLIMLEVEDTYGEKSTIARQIRYVGVIDTEDPENPANPDNIEAPFADFSISPAKILKGVGSQSIFLIDKSYDLQGLPVTSTFTLWKDGLEVTAVSFAAGSNDVSSLAAGDYFIELVVNNGFDVSEMVSRAFSIIQDVTVPTADAAPSTGNFIVNTPVTLTFSDLGGSGFKEQRVVVTGSTTDPSPITSQWSASSSRIVPINIAGTSYIHWEATDNAGNKNSGYFGPYTLTKQAIPLALTANPSSSVTYPTPVTLTATFDYDPHMDESPKGLVYFSIGSTNIGSAAIVDGVATLTYNHTATPLPTGTVKFSADFLGDDNYNDVDDELNYTINKNTAVSVTLGIQTNKPYDGTPFAPTGISVAGTTLYEVKYTGRDGTTYNSATPPTNAGKYTITVTTTDPGYVERSNYISFEIYQREISISLSTNPATANAKSDVELTANILNAVDLPAGTISFSVDDVPIGTDEAIIYFAGGYSASLIWPSIPAGTYNLKAEYFAGLDDNYTVTNVATISGYSVVKQNQTGFGFTESGPVIKTIIIDEDFTVFAEGGQTSGNVTYTVTEGADVISVDPVTGEVTILGVGTAVITATITGDDVYNQGEATIIVNVKAISVDIEDIKVGGKATRRTGNTFHTVTTECGVTEVEVDVTADPYATVEINGVVQSSSQAVTVNLPKYGENVINIKVSTQGDEQTYTLIVNRCYDGIEYEYPDVPTVNCNMQANGGYIFTAFQWYRNDVAITGANKPYYRISADNAIYYCEITLSNGDKWRTCDIQQQPFASSRIKAYPNPTQGQVTVSNDEQLSTGKIQVFDLYGRLILQPRTNPFDMSTLPEGVYVIKVNNETVRVVVKK